MSERCNRLDYDLNKAVQSSHAYYTEISELERKGENQNIKISELKEKIERQQLEITQVLGANIKRLEVELDLTKA